MCKTIKEPFFFFLSLLVLTYEKESSHSRFPIVQTRNRFLTAPLSCSLSLSPQKGHISNMLCSFEADGRLKVSVSRFSALLLGVMWFLDINLFVCVCL